MDVGTRISINVKYIYVITRMHFPWLNSVQPNNLDLIFYTLVRMTPQNIHAISSRQLNRNGVAVCA